MGTPLKSADLIQTLSIIPKTCFIAKENPGSCVVFSSLVSFFQVLEQPLPWLCSSQRFVWGLRSWPWLVTGCLMEEARRCRLGEGGYLFALLHQPSFPEVPCIPTGWNQKSLRAFTSPVAVGEGNYGRSERLASFSTKVLCPFILVRETGRFNTKFSPGWGSCCWGLA